MNMPIFVATALVTLGVLFSPLAAAHQMRPATHCVEGRFKEDGIIEGSGAWILRNKCSYEVVLRVCEVRDAPGIRQYFQKHAPHLGVADYILKDKIIDCKPITHLGPGKREEYRSYTEGKRDLHRVACRSTRGRNKFNFEDITPAFISNAKYPEHDSDFILKKIESPTMDVLKTQRVACLHPKKAHKYLKK